MLQRATRKTLLCLGLLLISSVAKAEIKSVSILNLSNANDLSQMGVWEQNILDPNQSIKMEIVQDQSELLKITFDVDSSAPAKVGFWLKLEELDLSGYDCLHLKMKTESKPNFSGSYGIQFMNSQNRKAVYFLQGVRNEWRDFQIPLKKFKRIHDWTQIKYLEILISDSYARPKEGILFIKDIFLSSAGMPI